ncbi:predicted protein [Phaeodactylum tricornutum CCAP 1055/1]|uniref:Uncharacterized protein n=3 Tax=Phaeodactylum tricornutum TaxID=2850 RepID=B7FV68_PHATC|nr:predicted protein [Phaeodactylum tricornutum CCAP 1055/1]EEC49571.1 predicted protein [Phaeodactylum tricornutum CCAP 1055/1]|eukprot:XP_002178873.1 predicted protein [Phaeodactylum tricornutum CCAP 1055/1]
MAKASSSRTENPRSSTKEPSENPQETTGLLSGQTKQPSHAVEANYSGEDLNPQSLGYKIFTVISTVAIIVAVLEILAQSITFAIHGGVFVQHILRFYILFFCILFICAELQLQTVTSYVPFLKSWIYRGFLYTFVGVIGVEESYATLAQTYPEIPGVKEQAASLFLKIVSITMLSFGVLYMAMSILCLHGVFDKMQSRGQEKYAEHMSVNIWKEQGVDNLPVCI